MSIFKTQKTVRESAIFRKIACIGDSLSSGEFETVNQKGVHNWHDIFEYSWGQFISRQTGATVYNFSRGGMTAKEYEKTFALANGFYDEDKSCQAYYFALGVNDFVFQKISAGSVSDADGEETDTFSYYFGKILRRYQTLSPNAKMFLITMPREGNKTDEFAKIQHKVMTEFAKEYKNTYLIDLYKKAPVYNDKFKQKYYYNGHLNPMGYAFTAELILNLTDEIIRKNPQDFYKVGLIGTPWYDEDEKE